MAFIFLNHSSFVNRNISVPSWISEDSMLDMALNFFDYKASIASSWRRKWQHTPVFLPGKSHGQRNLEGYSAWGPKESDMTEHKHSFLLLIIISVSQLFMVCFPSLSRNETMGT